METIGEAARRVQAEHDRDLAEFLADDRLELEVPYVSARVTKEIDGGEFVFYIQHFKSEARDRSEMHAITERREIGRRAIPTI